MWKTCMSLGDQEPNMVHDVTSSTAKSRLDHRGKDNAMTPRLPGLHNHVLKVVGPD